MPDLYGQQSVYSKDNSKSQKYKNKSNSDAITCMTYYLYSLTRFVKWLPNSIRSYKEPYDYFPLPSSNFRSTPYLIERRL